MLSRFSFVDATNTNLGLGSYFLNVRCTYAYPKLTPRVATSTQLVVQGDNLDWLYGLALAKELTVKIAFP